MSVPIEHFLRASQQAQILVGAAEVAFVVEREDWNILHTVAEAEAAVEKIGLDIVVLGSPDNRYYIVAVIERELHKDSAGLDQLELPYLL